MRIIHRSLWRMLAAVIAAASLGSGTASAFEAHNFIEPPFGSFAHIQGLAVDESNGNVYAISTGGKDVEVFGAEGGAPAGGGPSSFTGAAAPAAGFEGPEFGGPYDYWGGIAVDNACPIHERLTEEPLTAGECEALDPSSGDIYIHESNQQVVDKYRLNSSGAYEYVCQIGSYGASGNMCVPKVLKAAEAHLTEEGVTVDSSGDLYVTIGQRTILEYNDAGEWLHTFVMPEAFIQYGVDGLAVAPDGTMYAQVFNEERGTGEVAEWKRSSPTGPVEGEPSIVPHTLGMNGLAFDAASGQLFVDLRSSGEVLNGAHEIVSRFGAGVIANSEAVALDEATGEVYASNSTTQNIDRFGRGVPAALPAVDAPPPSLADVTRTSALLSATVDTGDATSRWKVEYVAAGEYRPGSPDPYSSGGSSALAKLAPVVGGTAVGPLPFTGLLAGTTYHYRLVASNELGTTYGPDHTFTTAAATPPIVTTGPVGAVTQTGVTLSGTVDARELQTSYAFEVGTDTSYGGAKLFGNAGRGGIEAVSASLQYLIPGVTYHYRLVASNEDGTTYGQDMAFTTPGVPAPLTQPPAAALLPSPNVVFPSVAGAITKPQGAGKAKKRSRKKASARKRAKRKQPNGRRRARNGGGKRK